MSPSWWTYCGPRCLYVCKSPTEVLLLLPKSRHNLGAVSPYTESRIAPVVGNPFAQEEFQELPRSDEELKNEGSTAPYNADYVSVTYTLWVGTSVTESYTITVLTEKNSTFYHVMEIAAEQDTRYVFQATEYAIGRYINAIDNIREDLVNNYYWMLYEIPELPDPSHPPERKFKTLVGVDGLIVEDGHHYLFWYRFVSAEEMGTPPA